MLERKLARHKMKESRTMCKLALAERVDDWRSSRSMSPAIAILVVLTLAHLCRSRSFELRALQ